jgi:MFS transporter, DHA1 family, multidrug resistance protein B
MKFRELHTNVKLRIIIDLFQKLINQMIFPFMAIYLASNFGSQIAGLLMFIVIVLGLVASFYGGHLSDLRGRKPIILTAELCNFFVLLIMSMVNSPWYKSPVITYILYILHNAFVYFSRPSLDAIIIDVSTPESRKFIYSISYWTSNLSFAIGAMIGAFFYRDFFYEVLLFASIFNLLIFFCYLFFITESKTNKDLSKNNKEKQYTNIFIGYKNIIKDSIFQRFFIASFILMGLEYQLANFISVRLSKEFTETNPFQFFNFDISISGVEMYGILRAENTFGVVILSIILSKLLNKISDKYRLYFGIVIFTLGYIFLGVSNQFWILIISMLIVTVGELTYVPIKQSILSVIIDDNNRTKYLAIYGLHYQAGMLISSIFITIGFFVPSFLISFLYGLMGGFSIILYKNIISTKAPRENSSKISL